MNWKGSDESTKNQASWSFVDSLALHMGYWQTDMIKRLILYTVLFTSALGCDSFVLKSPFKTEEAAEYFQQAQEYGDNGEFEKAIAFFDKADQLSPDTPIILHERGLLKSNMEKYPEAILDLNRSIELSTDESLKEMRIENRALTYMEMGNMEKACEDWKKSGSSGLSYLETYCK